MTEYSEEIQKASPSQSARDSALALATVLGWKSGRRDKPPPRDVAPSSFSSSWGPGGPLPSALCPTAPWEAGPGGLPLKASASS